MSLERPPRILIGRTVRCWEMSRAAQSPSFWVTEDGPSVGGTHFQAKDGGCSLVGWGHGPALCCQDPGSPILEIPRLTCCQPHAEALHSQGWAPRAQQPRAWPLSSCTPASESHTLLPRRGGSGHRCVPLSQSPAPACLGNLCLGHHGCCWKPCPPQQGAVPPARPPSGGPGPGHPARPGWARGLSGAEWSSWPLHPEPRRLPEEQRGTWPGHSRVFHEPSEGPRQQSVPEGHARELLRPRRQGLGAMPSGQECTLGVSAPLLPRVAAVSIDPELQAPFPTAPERGHPVRRDGRRSRSEPSLSP